MTTTASSTPTKISSTPWQSLRKEVRQEIMSTDILCEIIFTEEQAQEAKQCIEEVFTMMRNFEAKYSRFKTENELYQFNTNKRNTVSPELFDILAQAQYFHTFTDGLFDPSILPALEREGYTGASHSAPSAQKSSFSELALEKETLTVTKPENLYIDLGGIGKGYIVDKVATYLALHFENFLIDAGGDIYVRGSNEKEGYPYWAIDVEHPLREQESVALLLLSNQAVATSGRNKRHWKKDGQEKHHIIDPRTQKSAALDYQSVTVIAKNTLTADVLAKTLFIAGKEHATLLAKKWNIPAIFVEHTGNIIINQQAEAYVWKAL